MAQMATPSAPPEIATVATVETATRSGRATRDASASSSTAPPIMMTGGMMASHRIGGTAMVSDGTRVVAARRVAITSRPPRP